MRPFHVLDSLCWFPSPLKIGSFVLNITQEAVQLSTIKHVRLVLKLALYILAHMRPSLGQDLGHIEGPWKNRRRVPTISTSFRRSRRRTLPAHSCSAMIPTRHSCMIDSIPLFQRLVVAGKGRVCLFHSNPNFKFNLNRG